MHRTFHANMLFCSEHMLMLGSWEEGGIKGGIC